MRRFSLKVQDCWWSGAAVAMLLVMACGGDHPAAPSGDGLLAIGTWGGDTAGVLVSESLTHVHVGCTDGDIIGRVALDSTGHFSLSGSYQVHAYPVALGPEMPAQFSGQVRGNDLTLVVAVNDTIEKKLVILGPVAVHFGTEPRMGPCPICRVKDAEDRARRRMK